MMFNLVTNSNFPWFSFFSVYLRLDVRPPILGPDQSDFRHLHTNSSFQSRTTLRKEQALKKRLNFECHQPLDSQNDDHSDLGSNYDLFRSGLCKILQKRLQQLDAFPRAHPDLSNAIYRCGECFTEETRFSPVSFLCTPNRI